MPYAVSVGAGSLRSANEDAQHFPYKWTPEGVTVEAEFTGAHLLHLATAGCVLNDISREAPSFGITVNGVRVTAEGDFDSTTWRTNGIIYVVELDSEADTEQVSELLRRVDEVAEIPRAIRAGGPVHQRHA
jgi:uncharacterized OsmC-like protein